MSGPATKTLKGALDIAMGSLVGWSAGTFLIDAGTLINHGTFAIESDADIMEIGLSGVIENHGIFIKTMGAGTTDVDALFVNHPAAEIDVGSGILALNLGLYNEGEVKVDLGNILDISFESSFDPGTLLGGAGKMKFSGDTSTHSVAYDGDLELEFSGGVVMILDGIMLETTGDILIDDAEIGGTGVLVAKGTATWEDGDIMEDAIFNISAIGSLEMSTAGIKNIYGGLDLDGPTSWTGGSIHMHGTALIDNSSAFTTDFDGEIDAAAGEGAISIGGGGVFEKTGGGSFTVIDPVVTNFGTIKASADTFDFKSFVTNHSVIHAAASGNVSFCGGSSWLVGADMTGAGEMDFYFGTNTFSTPISSSNAISFLLGSTNTIDAILTNDNEINLASTGEINGLASIISEGDFNFTGGLWMLKSP